MKRATAEFLEKLDAAAEARRQAILSAEDALTVSGQTYYVSNDGDDNADGRTPETAWRTLAKVSAATLRPGDGVRFRRGDLFRGQLVAQPGVGYGAYGSGDKPKLYAWDFDLADPGLWELWDAAHHIWRLKVGALDAGTLVFNGGEAHSRKLIPSYLNGGFVCRDRPDVPFMIAAEMTRDLDLFCAWCGRTTTAPSRGENFPIPDFGPDALGELYLRCDAGNPGAVWQSIELLAKRHLIRVGECDNVHIDNLCLRYTGEHAIAAGGSCVRGLTVTNCEIGWIGGSIQHYFGTDPNYPQGGRGTVTRYGNGVEIYGGCDGYRVENCWIYQCYDAGITHQISTFGKTYHLNHVRYTGNLVENCVYSIEYFLEKTDPGESRMTDIEIDHNLLRFSGFGWGQQRHNTDTPAHIKGWSYENTARNFRIHDNLFDRAAYRMLHLVAKEPESLPEMARNVYVQHMGATLGQYGANQNGEPEMLVFDNKADETIARILKDAGAEVYEIEPND